MALSNHHIRIITFKSSHSNHSPLDPVLATSASLSTIPTYISLPTHPDLSGMSKVSP
jgi:hypothetical protein